MIGTTRKHRLAFDAIWLIGVLLCAAASNVSAEDPSPQFPIPSPEPPCCQVRRFGPYVTPDPRATAPTLGEAIDGGLLPPFGWGWYGVGYPGGWGWNYGGWGFRGLSTPYLAGYPYPYGFNGSFWYPRGSSWPYPSLSSWRYGGPMYLSPLAAPGYPPYLLQSPYGAGPAADDGAPHFGQYYW